MAVFEKHHLFFEKIPLGRAMWAKDLIAKLLQAKTIIKSEKMKAHHIASYDAI